MLASSYVTVYSREYKMVPVLIKTDILLHVLHLSFYNI